MKRKATMAVSVACGVLCAACVFAYTQTVRSQADAERLDALSRYGGDQVQVVVAARDIAPGCAITQADLTTEVWVADLLPDGAVSDISDAVGQTTATSILEGEVVSTRRFGQASSALEVPAGTTAVSVPAKEVQAVGGAIEPGMQVDVYATGTTGTSCIGHGLQVLSTSASASDNSETVTWITLAVQPERAQEMVAAALGSQLYFTLPGA